MQNSRNILQAKPKGLEIQLVFPEGFFGLGDDFVVFVADAAEADAKGLEKQWFVETAVEVFEEEDDVVVGADGEDAVDQLDEGDVEGLVVGEGVVGGVVFAELAVDELAFDGHQGVEHFFHWGLWGYIGEGGKVGRGGVIGVVVV